LRRLSLFSLRSASSQIKFSRVAPPLHQFLPFFASHFFRKRSLPLPRAFPRGCCVFHPSRHGYISPLDVETKEPTRPSLTGFEDLCTNMFIVARTLDPSRGKAASVQLPGMFEKDRCPSIPSPFHRSADLVESIRTDRTFPERGQGRTDALFL